MPLPDDPTLIVWGSFTAPAGATTTLPATALNYTYHAPAAIVAGNVIYEITTAPAHGTMLLNGAAATRFTAQDLADGRVSYRHDGSTGATDMLQIFATVTETPGVISPYTPRFYRDIATSSTDTKGAFYAGLLLAGASAMPVLDEANWGAVYASGSTVTHTFSTAHANCAILLMTYAIASSTTSSPAAPAVSSVTYPGLSFTNLGGGTIHTSWQSAGTNYLATTRADLWWAPAASVLSANTLNVSYSGSPVQSFLNVYGYYNLADLTHPWGTGSGAVQTQAVSGPPGSLSLTTGTADPLVLPVLFELVTGGSDDTIGPSYGPKGYTQIGGGSSAGGAAGGTSCVQYQRTSIATASIPVTIADTLPPDTGGGGTPAVGTSPQIFLEWSDDRGRSFGNPVGQPFGDRGEYLTSVQWQRLGLARDRVFRLSWSAPVRTALLGAYIEVDTSAKS